MMTQDSLHKQMIDETSYKESVGYAIIAPTYEKLTTLVAGKSLFEAALLESWTTLHFFDAGIVTSHQYRNEVFESHEKLSIKTSFIDDNVRSHRAKDMDYCLREEDSYRQD